MLRRPSSAWGNTLACTLLSVILSACSQGGSDSPSSSAREISGSAVKGVLISGWVEAIQTDDMGHRTTVGSARTNQTGEFSLTLNSEYIADGRPLLLELSADQSTYMTCDVLPGCTISQTGEYAEFGEQFKVPENFRLLGIYSPSSSTSAFITPISHLIASTALDLPGGLSGTNVQQASNWAQSDLGLQANPLDISPVDLTKLSTESDPSAVLGDQSIKQTLIGASLLDASMSAAWRNEEYDLQSVELLALISSASEQAQTLQNHYNQNQTDPVPPSIEQLLITVSSALATQENEISSQSLSIQSQPESVTLSEGTDLTLRVSAISNSGSSINYQWYRGNQPLTGQTSTQLSIASAQQSDSGDYRVEVASASIALFSDIATVMVTPVTLPPSIISQPLSQSLSTGQDLRLSVEASGSGSLQYNWLKGGSIIPGATNPILEITNVSSSDSGSYRVSVSSQYGETLSDVADITIIETVTPVNIEEEPQAVTVVEGNSAELSVTASGGGFIRYQWYRNGTAITGATNRSLVFSDVSLGDDALYYVEVSNSQGSINSQSARLTVLEVLPELEITAQPINQSTTEGDAVTFSVSASGSGPLSFQWYKDGVALSGRIASQLSFSNVSIEDAGTYYVLVTDGITSATSVGATLSVTRLGDVFAFDRHPQDVAIQAGNTANFSISLTDSLPADFQWYFNGSAISGANGTSFTIENARLEDVGFYHVVAQRDSETITSNPAELEVSPFASLELAWAIPTQRASGEPLSIDEISGYVIEYGYDFNNLDRLVNIAGAQTTSHVLEDLSSGVLYLRLATVDSSGVVGSFTGIASVLIP